MKLFNFFSNNKMYSDFSWNFLGYGLIAISGLLINILILKFYGNEYLGVFNQIYAIYLILSQLTVGGYHLSVQRYISEHFNDKKTCSDILFSSLILTLFQSLIIVIIIFKLSYLPGKILESDMITRSFVYCLPALIFFSVNKVLMSYFNSIREFKFFSIFMSLRVVLILVFLIIFYLLKIELVFLPVIFCFSEIFLFILIITNKYIFIERIHLKSTKNWIKLHFNHGAKSFVGHFLLDLNTKVDLLLLGYFSSDFIVGIYSLASSIVEGISQIPYIFRNLYNPLITRMHFFKSKSLFKRVVDKAVIFNYKLFFFVWIISSSVLALILYFLFNEYEIYKIFISFLILNTGLFFASGYIPFQMIFNQTGHPNIQTIYTTLICFSNIILNIILINSIGLYGAAVATAVTFILQFLYLKVLVKRILNLKI